MTTAYPTRGSPDDPSYSPYLRADSTSAMSPDVSSVSSIQDEETQNALALEEDQELQAALQESIRQYELEAVARAKRLVESEFLSRRSASPRTIASTTRSILSHARRGSRVSHEDLDFPFLTDRSTVSARDFDSTTSPAAEMILQSSGYRRGDDDGRHVAFHLPPGFTTAYTASSAGSVAPDASSLSSRSSISSFEASSISSQSSISSFAPSTPPMEYFHSVSYLLPEKYLQSLKRDCRGQKQCHCLRV